MTAPCRVPDREIERLLPLCYWLAGRYAPRVRDSADSADDLAQVAMLGVLKAAESWDQRGEFVGWARLKAEREIQHHLRDSIPGTRYGRALRVTSLDANDNNYTHKAFGVEDRDTDMRVTVRAALNQLDPHDRAAVCALVVHGCPQHQVAAALGCSQMAVSRRLRRTLKQLAGMPQLEGVAA